jgi:hypothetical protein
MAVESSHFDLQDPQVRSIAGLVPSLPFLLMRTNRNRSYPFQLHLNHLGRCYLGSEHPLKDQLQTNYQKDLYILPDHG